MRSLDDLLSLLEKRNINISVALACPEDLEVLAAVFDACNRNLCNFILYGNEELTLSLINSMNLELNEKVRIVDVKTKEQACIEAVKSIRNHEADIVMKGLVDTSILLKEVLNPEYGLRMESILSHVMVIELPKIDRLLFLSDGGLIIDPTIDQMKFITKNAIFVANCLKISNPKVALISAIEKINPKMPSTIKCQAIQEMYEQGLFEHCIISGPLALDVALDSNAARIKNINNPVAGHADILIVPYIEVANVLYKGWMFGCDNVKSAGIIVGAKAPIVLTSRSDSHESKLYSLALSIIMKG